jgi:preprotein translocase subunit SecG
MQQILLVVHVLVCLALIALVVLQRGKGAEAGAAFGGGASQTVFGSRGAGTFLIKITGSLAALFFITSIGLNYLTSVQNRARSPLSGIPVSTSESDQTIPITTPGLPANLFDSATSNPTQAVPSPSESQSE